MINMEFRGKSVYTGEWVYGDFRRKMVEYDDDMWEERSFIYVGTDHMVEVEVDEKTVGQYTGLNDKTGKEVYEKDITHSKYGARGGQILIVKEISIYGLVFERIRGGIYFYSGLPQRDTIKVIGNIYDNPDLIGGI